MSLEYEPSSELLYIPGLSAPPSGQDLCVEFRGEVFVLSVEGLGFRVYRGTSFIRNTPDP